MSLGPSITPSAEARSVRAGEALHASEEWFRALTEHVTDTVTVLDGQGNIVFKSPPVVPQAGFSAEELLGDNAFQYIHPDDLAKAMATWAAVRAKPGAVSAVEFRVRYKDGSWGWLEATGRNLLHDPRITGVVVNCRNVSERKIAEEALRESEEKYRQLFELESDAIFLIDNETGDILETNPAASGLYDYTRSEFLKMKNSDVSAEPRMTQAAAKEGSQRVPLRWHRRKDGTVLPVEITATHFLRKERPVHIAAIRDITDRMRAEETLRAGEERLRLVTDNLTDVVAQIDVDGVIQYASPSHRPVLGYEPADVVGRPALEFLHPEDVHQAREAIRHAFEYGSSVGLTARARHADGHWLWVELVASRIPGEHGEPMGLVYCARDITQRVEAEEALRLSEEQLRQAHKMEALGRLAGGMAHDFNNMLTVISGYGELILNELSPDDPLRDDATEVLKAAKSAAGLTRRLLAFSRQQIIQPVVLDLNETISGMGEMLTRLLGEDVELSIVGGNDLWKISADPGQIEQVIMNLAINARDAMPTGGRLAIKTANIVLEETYTGVRRAVKPGPYVMLAVSDTGCGMDEGTRARVFDPFFTTKEPDKGTGLGLSTAYGIVKQNSGYIWIYSEAGQGTVVKIYIPQEEVDALRAPESVVPPPLRPPQGRKTILLVEDGEAIRRFVALVLSNDDCTVIEAESGRRGLMLVEQNLDLVDLLITDVVMPGMSGQELAHRLRERRPELPVLFMSGYTADAIANYGVLEEGVFLLEKPFTADTLIRKVREMLNTG